MVGASFCLTLAFARAFCCFLPCSINKYQDIQRPLLRFAAAEEALDGYAEAKPMVFCGLYPTEAEEYEVLCCQNCCSPPSPPAGDSGAVCREGGGEEG